MNYQIIPCIERTENQIQEFELLKTGFYENDNISGDSIRRLFFQFLGQWDLVLNTVAFDNLTSSGMDILSNDSIKTELLTLYSNPRGSTSYGEEFGNLIHHDYPNHDYDDLMSGVDAVIKKGFVDDKNLFVTGGSGGGVLTAWIVGKTDRFRAAVVAKPVINWYSFVLYADGVQFFSKYWFAKKPWEDPESYLKRSPLTYVGNVTTPTMLLTGEQDFRTPIAESEQFYAALKLANVETAMVRIPGASHGIANRPSNLVAKLASILAWFEKYKDKE